MNLELCVVVFLFFIFFYKIEFLLYPNLSVYVCEAPSWRLESRSLPLTPHTPQILILVK